MKADKQLRIGVLASVGRLERLSQGETLSGSFGAAHFFGIFYLFWGLFINFFQHKRNNRQYFFIIFLVLRVF